MELTVYNKKTGQIIKTMTGNRKIIVNCLSKNEAYIEGIYPLNGAIINGKYQPKKYKHPDIPSDNLRDVLEYAREGKETCIKALENTGMAKSQAEKYIIDNYHVFRSKRYPDIQEFIDAEVKIHSGDAALVKKGQEQKEKYIQQCLDVKNEFKKG